MIFPHPFATPGLDCQLKGREGQRSDWWNDVIPQITWHCKLVKYQMNFRMIYAVMNHHCLNSVCWMMGMTVSTHQPSWLRWIIPKLFGSLLTIVFVRTPHAGIATSYSYYSCFRILHQLVNLKKKSWGSLNFTEYRELVHRYRELCRWYVYCRLQHAIFFGVDPRSIRCHSCFFSIFWQFTHEGFEQLHSMWLGATRSAHATLAARQCNLRSIAQLGSSRTVKLGFGGEVRGSKLNPACVVHVLPDLVWKTGGFATHGELSKIT